MRLSLNANSFMATVQTVTSQGSNTLRYRDFIYMTKYQSVYPITLSSIYTLTK